VPIANNPLLQDWTQPYGLPPFQDISPEHFEPAFEVAMREELAEVDAIAAQAAPTFANTVPAFDRSGRLLTRIGRLFGNLTSSETSPALQAVERAMAPRLAAHRNAIYMHSGVFDRIDTLHAQRDSLGLDDEDLALLERVHFDFVLSGAKLPPESRRRYAQITQELAELTTRFAQNLLAEESSWLLHLKDEADLAGLPASVRSAARTAALERGLGTDAYAMTLSPSLAEPFLTFSSRRDLREAVWRARVARGAHEGEHDNRPVAARITALRQELAALHGYPSYADCALADRMAKDTNAVLDLLRKAWEPAKAKAAEDRALLTATAERLEEPTPIAAWDWRYLAEKVRQQQFDLQDAELKPYFALDNMIAAMFDCAGRLFGLRFVEQAMPRLYHPDVRMWEVRGRGNALVGVFLGDNFARPSKRSGAWMSVFRSQSGIDGGTLPIVINIRDLIDKLLRARRFDQAWATIQYTGPALIDMALHSLPQGTPVDIAQFEARQRELLGVPEDIGLRHHLSHFQHLFAGGYAAGYYVYMWAEVLDADAFDAFMEAGDPFHRETADRLHRYIYSAGGTRKPADAYRAFRGRDAAVEPMLAKRGLLAS
jgi:peptidyl-dipeptidase Dcp